MDKFERNDKELLKNYEVIVVYCGKYKGTIEEYSKLFFEMSKNFFEDKEIKDLDENLIFDEMIIDLYNYPSDQYEKKLPDEVHFRYYDGDIESLRAIVNEVEEGWPGLFNETDCIYCGYIGDTIASFCIVEDMGVHNYKGDRIKIAGPGCVGTRKEYRNLGIGLTMVDQVTQILKEKGYDISYIHYTGVSNWYKKLGYETILKWNKYGIIENE